MIDRDSSGLAWRVILVVYAALLVLALTALSLREWPESLPVGHDANPETRFLILAAIFGALGGSVRMASSILILNRRLPRNWIPWLVVQPVVGLILAVLTYFALRGGLIMDARSLNPHGIAALSGAAGLFGGQALFQLNDLLYALFQKKPVRQDDSAGGTSRRG
jgi:hypothetical protein